MLGGIHNISKQHLEQAIEEIDRDGIPKERASSSYDLVHKGKSYPPKLGISIANRFANEIQLNEDDFQGGQGTIAYKLLEKEGFELVAKNDPISKLIENSNQLTLTKL